MNMTENELKAWEESLRAEKREVLERERAVMNAEKRLSHREDIERDDYLFNAINQHRNSYRPVVVEVPQTQKTDSPLDCVTAIAAMLSAVFTLTILVLLLV